MRYRRIHSWSVTVPRARRIQERLRESLDLAPAPSALAPRFVAGADVSYDRGSDVIYGAVVVLSWPDLVPVEVASAVDRARFPYVPGYLSFREIPVLLRAFRKIRRAPDVVLCDGQGIAHPRGLGLASHLGLVLGVPTIGCAKSRLVGEHREPRPARGSWTRLTYEGRRVGTVLRTRAGVAPIYVSPGHAIDDRTALRIVLGCCTTRIPEPTRRAHIEVNRIRREGISPTRALVGARTARSRADQIGLPSPRSRSVVDHIPSLSTPALKAGEPAAADAAKARTSTPGTAREAPSKPKARAPAVDPRRPRGRPWPGA